MNVVPLIFVGVLNFVESETFGGKMFSIELILVQFFAQATYLFDCIQWIPLTLLRPYFNCDFFIEEFYNQIKFLLTAVFTSFSQRIDYLLHLLFLSDIVNTANKPAKSFETLDGFPRTADQSKVQRKC